MEIRAFRSGPSSFNIDASTVWILTSDRPATTPAMIIKIIRTVQSFLYGPVFVITISYGYPGGVGVDVGVTDSTTVVVIVGVRLAVVVMVVVPVDVDVGLGVELGKMVVTGVGVAR